MRVQLALPLLLAALAGCSGAAKLIAPASEDAVVTKRVKSTQEVGIRSHAQWDSQCQAKGVPWASMVKAPTSGKVEFRKETATITGSDFGQVRCDGTRIDGIRIYYVPEPGFKGTVDFMYDVQMNLGQVRQPVKIIVE